MGNSCEFGKRPPALVAQEFPSRLLALRPKVSTYVISFLVVAVYRTAHHRVFRSIRGYDRTLLWLNFVFLMTISFLPLGVSLRVNKESGPGRIRTCDTRPRKPLLYPLSYRPAQIGTAQGWYRSTRGASTDVCNRSSNV